MNRRHMNAIRLGQRLLLCLFLAWGEFSLASDTVLNYGTVLRTSDDGWKTLQHQLGAGFAPSETSPLITLPFDNKLVVWYVPQSAKGTVYLSIFEHGQERILQDDLHSFYLGTQANLAATDLNQDSRLDLLILSTDVIGIGHAAEEWNRYLSILFDGQTSAGDSIPLSAVDASIGDPNLGECEQPGDCYRHERDSCVMALPPWGIRLTEQASAHWQRDGMPETSIASLAPLIKRLFADERAFLRDVEALIGAEQTSSFRQSLLHTLEPAPGGLYVWSRSSSDQSEQVSYQLESYAIRQQQIFPIEQKTGDYQHTVNLLRALLQQRRAQQDAPPPIFLFFWNPNHPDYRPEDEEQAWLEEWGQ